MSATTAAQPHQPRTLHAALQLDEAVSGGDQSPSPASWASETSSRGASTTPPSESNVEDERTATKQAMNAAAATQPQHMSVKVLILGAGPTGLGAAHQLHQDGTDDWLLVDSADRPGGMAITEEDEHGFRWDLGGHVIHSHYPAFDKALALHTDWVHPHRGGWVRVRGRWCPTPIQQSLGNLAEGQQIVSELAQDSSVEGAATPDRPSSNLGEYYRNHFGATLNDVFFAPFNRKQWAWDLTQLDHTWTSLRSGSGSQNVPQASRTPVALDRPKDTSAFPYPRLGTGSLWQSIAGQLPASKLRYGTTVVRLDVDARRAHLSTGQTVSYARCISSVPLSRLLTLVGSQRPALAATVPHWKHSSTTAVGLGFTGALPSVLEGKSWVFSADPAVSFHRATVLTNFSPALSGSGRWSIMFETSSSPHRPVAVDRDSLVADHLAELRRWGAVGETETPLSVWYKHLDLGYPLPFLGRDDLLSSSHHATLAELERTGILSRGRFGGWRYESSNQDYAFVQGVEAADVVTKAAPESVYWPTRPDAADVAPLDAE